MTQLATPEQLSECDRPADSATDQQRQLLKQAVAALSDEAIYSMSPRELLFAVRTAGAFAMPQGEGRDLHYADRATLERMAFLSRRACRHGDRLRRPPARPR